MVFLDLKKAFDTVDHNILLKKLGMYGMGANALEWFYHYLVDRNQHSKVNNVILESLNTKCSVPQGSILGPLLFIVYINDLVEILSETKANLYADDTAMYVSGESYIDVILALRIEMDNLVQWLRLNKLTLNVAKTKLMIFGTKPKLRAIRDSPLKIGDETVERVAVFKYLGILLDESLDWEPHVNKLYSKTCSKVGLLKKIRSNIDHSTALPLYKSLVLPHLDYCDTIYMTANADVLNKLQLVRNIACRTLLLANKYASVIEMHTELGLMHLKCRRDIHLGNICHKTAHSEKKTGLSKYFIKVWDRGNRVSRLTNEYNICVPNIRNNNGRKSISFRGLTFWNAIHNELKKYCTIH